MGIADGLDVGKGKSAVSNVSISLVKERLTPTATVFTNIFLSDGAEQSYGRLFEVINMASISLHHSK